MKKLMVFLLAISVIGCVAFSAIAEDLWVEAGNNENYVVLIRLPVEDRGETFRFWEKTIFYNDKYIIKYSRGLKGRMRYCLSLMEYKKDSPVSKYISTKYYDDKGRLIGSFGEDQEWRVAPLGSGSEVAWEVAKEYLGK